ncbi:ABC transporter ATP-binding protein [Leucothrix sargassi]|nr:ABC transporter ATP-binding protein [Leucothrix sargassi]
MRPAPALSLNNIKLAFDQRVIFDDLSVDILAKQWTCLLGQSGCGKTTLLRLIAGLQQADSGHIEYLDKSTKADTDESTGKPNIAYMAQDDCLMPWLSLLDNVMLGARLRGDTSPDASEKATELLATVGLADHANQRPATLSGGQRQRVALARTLFEDCPIVLMDEPFSKLDAINRYKLQNLAAQAFQGRTVILVTHDPQEALRLAHQVLVLSNKSPNVSEFARFDTDIPRELDQPTVTSHHKNLLQYLQ